MGGSVAPLYIHSTLYTKPKSFSPPPPFCITFINNFLRFLTSISLTILENYYEKYGKYVMESILMFLKYFFEMHQDLFSISFRDEIQDNNYELNSIPNILLFAYLGKLLEKIPLSYKVQWEDKKFGRYMKYVSEKIMMHLNQFSDEDFENAINDNTDMILNMNELIVSFDNFEIH